MSKAFTRESDQDLETSRQMPAAKLPSGVTNYITAQGVRQLGQKLDMLLSEPANSSNRNVIEDLRRALASAVVVDPPPLPWTQVLFGAFVTVCNQSGEKMTYRLVGVDETDLEKNYISWRSPIAKALIKAKIGEQAHIRAPGGEQQLTIVDIAYQL